MNRVSFAWRAYEYGAGSGEELAIEIDGTSLVELTAAVEKPHAHAEGHPHLAGSYAGLSRFAMSPEKLERHLLGKPALESDDGLAVLLGCECGEWGCWPLGARIHLDQNIVKWSDFHNRHRGGWDLSALGPFVFDREQYETSARKAAAAAREPIG